LPTENARDNRPLITLLIEFNAFAQLAAVSLDREKWLLRTTSDSIPPSIHSGDRLAVGLFQTQSRRRIFLASLASVRATGFGSFHSIAGLPDRQESERVLFTCFVRIASSNFRSCVDEMEETVVFHFLL